MFAVVGLMWFGASPGLIRSNRCRVCPSPEWSRVYGITRLFAISSNAMLALAAVICWVIT